MVWQVTEGPPSVPSPPPAPTSVPLAQGMVLSAEYIKKKLEQEMVLSQAFGRDLVRRFPCRALGRLSARVGAGDPRLLTGCSHPTQRPCPVQMRCLRESGRGDF